MKKLLIVCFFLLVIWLLMVCTGCAGLREQSEREMSDLKSLRVTATNYHAITNMQLGIVDGAIGERKTELPVGVVKAMDELKLLAAKDPNELTDYELGYSMGLRARIFYALAKEIVERAAPELLRYLP